jgi:hypothetical protein
VLDVNLQIEEPELAQGLGGARLVDRLRGVPDLENVLRSRLRVRTSRQGEVEKRRERGRETEDWARSMEERGGRKKKFYRHVDVRLEQSANVLRRSFGKLHTRARDLCASLGVFICATVA